MIHLLNQLAAPLLRGNAYLDPGSGSLLLQALLAALLGGAYLLKVYWKKLKGLFKKNKDEETPVIQEPGDHDPQP